MIALWFLLAVAVIALAVVGFMDFCKRQDEKYSGKEDDGD